MPAPTPERVAHLTVCAWELALAAQSRNGAPLPADVAWCVEAAALSAPGTAARCPRVLAVLAPEARATVHAAQAVTAPPPPPSQTASSEERPWMTSIEAAQALGIGEHGARAAARRGRVAATHGPGGRWEIDRASLAEYQRRRRTP
jgi:hypothetical protein